MQHLTILHKGTDEVAENSLFVIVSETLFFHRDIDFGEYEYENDYKDECDVNVAWWIAEDVK